MFYVFSTNGKLFGGPLEKLRPTEGSAASEPVRDSSFADSLAAISAEGQTDTAISSRAIEQYRAVLPQQNQRELIYHVYQVMSKPVQVLEQTASVYDAYRAFIRYPFGCFPVVNSFHQIVSLIRRDKLFNLLVQQPLETLQLTPLQQLTDTLEPEVISTAPVTDVRRAAQSIVERQLSSLPVVEDNGKLLGIIAKRDILSCLAKDPPLSVWS